MNEFNHEELQKIFFWGMDRLESIGVEEFASSGDVPVYEKIQFMIENHCNHDYKKTPSKSGMYFIAICNKCKNQIPYYKCGHCKQLEKKECKHESDGMCYTSNPPQNKCKLCGEFYR